jgi:hypothetical protein
LMLYGLPWVHCTRSVQQILVSAVSNIHGAAVTHAHCAETRATTAPGGAPLRSKTLAPQASAECISGPPRRVVSEAVETNPQAVTARQELLPRPKSELAKLRTPQESDPE